MPNYSYYVKLYLILYISSAIEGENIDTTTRIAAMRKNTSYLCKLMSIELVNPRGNRYKNEREKNLHNNFHMQMTSDE